MSALMELEINLDDENLPTNKLLLDLYKDDFTGVVRRVAETEFVQDQGERFISDISRQFKAAKSCLVPPSPSSDTPLLSFASALDPIPAQGLYVSLDSDTGSTDAALTEVAAKAMFRAQEARLHSSMTGLISPLGAQIAAPDVQLSAQIATLGVQLGVQIEAQTKEIAVLTSQNAAQSTAIEALTESVRALTDEVKKLKTMSKSLLELAAGDPRETKRSRGMQQADQQPLEQTIDMLRAQLALLGEPELEEKPHPSVIEQVRGQNQQVDGN